MSVLFYPGQRMKINSFIIKCTFCQKCRRLAQYTNRMYFYYIRIYYIIVDRYL